MEKKAFIIPENIESQNILESFGGNSDPEYAHKFAIKATETMVELIRNAEGDNVSLAKIIGPCCEKLASDQAEAFFVVFIAGSLKNEMARAVRDMEARANAAAALQKVFNSINKDVPGKQEESALDENQPAELPERGFN